MSITLVVRARQHIDFDLGAQFDLRLSADVFQSGRFDAGVFTQATWAKAKSTSSYYGVIPAHYLVTGLPVIETGSGWFFGSLGLLWSFDLTRNRVVVGNMESRQMYGDADRSAITERSINYYLSGGLAYRF